MLSAGNGMEIILHEIIIIPFLTQHKRQGTAEITAYGAIADAFCHALP